LYSCNVGGLAWNTSRCPCFQLSSTVLPVLLRVCRSYSQARLGLLIACRHWLLQTSDIDFLQCSKQNLCHPAILLCLPIHSSRCCCCCCCSIVVVACARAALLFVCPCKHSTRMQSPCIAIPGCIIMLAPPIAPPTAIYKGPPNRWYLPARKSTFHWRTSQVNCAVRSVSGDELLRPWELQLAPEPFDGLDATTNSSLRHHLLPVSLLRLQLCIQPFQHRNCDLWWSTPTIGAQAWEIAGTTQSDDLL
jgi:hypothetical protein